MLCYTYLACFVLHVRRMNFFPVYSKFLQVVSNARKIYAVYTASQNLQGLHDNLESIL